MLRFIEQLPGMTIKSLRSGTVVGRLDMPILNPHKMSIEAFYVESPRFKDDRVLFTQDIRHVDRTSLIIDDEDDVIEVSEDLVRLQEMLSINFQLIHKKVISDSKRKIGKVNNFAIDDETFRIQKMYVSRTGITSFASSDLIIGRNQIAEVTDRYVVVKEGTLRAKNSAKNKSPILRPQA